MFFECNTNVKQMLRFVFAEHINTERPKTSITHLHTTHSSNTNQQHAFTQFVLSPVCIRKNLCVLDCHIEIRLESEQIQ